MIQDDVCSLNEQLYEIKLNIQQNNLLKKQQQQQQKNKQIFLSERSNRW